MTSYFVFCGFVTVAILIWNLRMRARFGCKAFAWERWFVVANFLFLGWSIGLFAQGLASKTATTQISDDAEQKAWGLAMAVTLFLIGVLVWSWSSADRVLGELRKQWDAAIFAVRDKTENEVKESFSQESDARTLALEAEVERRKQAQARLAEVNRQVSETARLAGMAEVANGVLHNVGNVLNSINVSTSIIADGMKKVCLADFPPAVALLVKNRDNVGPWLTQDTQGRKWIPFMEILAEQWQRESSAIEKEIAALTSAVGHAKDIVARQQGLSCISGMMESVSMNAVIEDALKIEASGLTRHNITVEREFAPLPALSLDKVKVMQILVNLIRNAREAMASHDTDERRLRICTRMITDEHLNVEVRDNGVGITPEHATRLFAYGFTTKKDGHGFGLHSSALAATELGGELSAESLGVGIGAVFSLVLPVRAEEPTAKMPVSATESESFTVRVNNRADESTEKSERIVIRCAPARPPISI